MILLMSTAILGYLIVKHVDPETLERIAAIALPATVVIVLIVLALEGGVQ